MALEAPSALELPDGEIHLWLASTDGLELRTRIERYRQMLSYDEREQESRFRFEDDRRLYLLTRVLVRTTLSRYFAAAPETWRFERTTQGKPYLAGPATVAPHCHISISHADGLAAFALASRAPLGIDVESRARRAVPPEVAERYFAEEEIQALRALPEHLRNHAFLELWTLKESYMKAVGKGLALSPRSMAFQLEPGRLHVRFDASLEDRADDWNFWQFESPSAHVIAVCGRRSDPGASRLVVRFAPLPAVGSQIFPSMRTDFGNTSASRRSNTDQQLMREWISE